MSEVSDENVKAPVADEQSAKRDGIGSLLDGPVDTTVRRAKKCKNITKGICHILATFNNTKVCFSDPNGNVISWASAGKCNFRGSRKSTAYAAQMVVQDAGKTAMSHGMKEVSIRVSGPGMGRDSAIRTIQALGLAVDEIVDVTPIPHNGCRPRKARRA
ncbi:MAG: 30S ribosomal protein S11 [Puniceicoccales bacterium]|jgi:small subunit ribosomal protein S11|nr:30S ribosomal protein S11 [Puniceicoccales bacterium]